MTIIIILLALVCLMGAAIYFMAQKVQADKRDMYVLQDRINQRDEALDEADEEIQGLKRLMEAYQKEEKEARHAEDELRETADNGLIDHANALFPRRLRDDEEKERYPF